MDHTLLNRFVERRDGLSVYLLSRLLIALSQRFAQQSQLRADAGYIDAIPCRASFRLTGALKGRKMICHAASYLRLLEMFRRVRNKLFYGSKLQPVNAARQPSAGANAQSARSAEAPD